MKEVTLVVLHYKLKEVLFACTYFFSGLVQLLGLVFQTCRHNPVLNINSCFMSTVLN